MPRNHTDQDLHRLLTQTEARRVFRASERDVQRFCRRGWLREFGWVASAPPARTRCEHLFEVVDRYLIRRLEERLAADPDLAAGLFVRTLSAQERARVLRSLFQSSVAGIARRKPAQPVRQRTRAAAGSRLRFALRRRFPHASNLEFEQLAEAASASDDPKVAEALWTDELVDSVRCAALVLSDATTSPQSPAREAEFTEDEAQLMDLEEDVGVVEEEAPPLEASGTATPSEEARVEAPVEAGEEDLLFATPVESPDVSTEAPIPQPHAHHPQHELTSDEFTALAEPTSSEGTPFEGEEKPKAKEAADPVPADLEIADQAEANTLKEALPTPVESAADAPVAIVSDPRPERWDALERQLEKISDALERATENLAKQMSATAAAPTEPVPPAPPPAPVVDPELIRGTLAPLVDRLGEQAATQQRGNQEIATALGKIAADLEALPRQLASVPVATQAPFPVAATAASEAASVGARRAGFADPVIQLGCVSGLATGWAVLFWLRLASPTLAAVSLGLAMLAAGAAVWQAGRSPTAAE